MLKHTDLLPYKREVEVTFAAWHEPSKLHGKDTGGKPLAMGRGKANPKKNPTPGGRADRKVVLEYSSDETPDENPTTGGGSGGTETGEEANTPDSANQPSPCDYY